MSVKVLEENSMIEALQAVMTAQERSERSLSFLDLTGYEDGVIGRSIREMVAQIDTCVREISALMATLRESDDPVRPVPPEPAEGAPDEGAAAAYAEAEERFWQERMRLVHAVERCAIRVDAARAQGDVAFMDGLLATRQAGMPVEEEAALTDIFLSLKDVYDAASEAAEKLRYGVARREM